MKHCDYCGEAHRKHNPCPPTTSETMSTRSNTMVAKLAAQAGSHEDVKELTTSLHTLSFEEREKWTREAIQEVEDEIRLAELEDHL